MYDAFGKVSARGEGRHRTLPNGAMGISVGDVLPCMPKLWKPLDKNIIILHNFSAKFSVVLPSWRSKKETGAGLPWRLHYSLPFASHSLRRL